MGRIGESTIEMEGGQFDDPRGGGDMGRQQPNK
jgi:hypothetical protein